MTSPMQPGDPATTEVRADQEPDAAEERSDRRAVVAIIVVLALVLVGLLVWWLVARDDDEDPVLSDTTTTTEATTTTTAETTTTDATTTTEAFPSLTPEERAAVVFPDAEGSRRFDDPRAAALAFATDLVGFDDPIVGEFAEGDARSGEVELRDRPDGFVTTVLVRQFGPGDSWWVLGATTDEIVLTTPSSRATVTSPLALEGQASAFEGTVQVRILQDGQAEPIGEGFVTGSGTAELGPFSGEVPFGAPTRDGGAAVLRTVSAEDGSVMQATVVRLAFG